MKKAVVERHDRLRHYRFAAIILTAFIATSCQDQADGTSNRSKESDNAMKNGNTARDGDIAVRQEYEAALKTNSVKSWELFIARHPQSEWGEDAKKQLQHLKNQL